MPNRPFIVIGDKTDHGGVVIEGAPSTYAGALRIARVGDKVSCPRSGHGASVIATGDPTCIIEGKAAARHGDTTSCGAVLLATTQVVTTD